VLVDSHRGHLTASGAADAGDTPPHRAPGPCCACARRRSAAAAPPNSRPARPGMDWNSCMLAASGVGLLCDDVLGYPRLAAGSASAHWVCVCRGRGSAARASSTRSASPLHHTRIAGKYLPFTLVLSAVLHNEVTRLPLNFFMTELTPLLLIVYVQVCARSAIKLSCMH
jgi:hypothetical protein